MYSIDSLPFVEQARSLAATSRDRVDALYSDPVRRSTRLLDICYDYASQLVWTFPSVRSVPSAIERLTFSVLHKNQIALCICLDLIRSGSVGAARVLFRQIFEAQLLGKFVSVSGDVRVAERWADCEPLFVGRIVFPRLLDPSPESLRSFLRVLHPFVHPSPSSQQVSLSIIDNIEEIGLDLMLLSLLLHNHVHFVCRHVFSDRSRRMARRYVGRGTVGTLYREARELMAQDRIAFSTEGSRMVRTYRGAWTVSAWSDVA